MKLVLILLLISLISCSKNDSVLTPEVIELFETKCVNNEGIHLIATDEEKYTVYCTNDTTYSSTDTVIPKKHAQSLTKLDLNNCYSVCEKNQGLEKITLSTICEETKGDNNNSRYCARNKQTTNCICRNKITKTTHNSYSILE